MNREKILQTRNAMEAAKSFSSGSSDCCQVIFSEGDRVMLKPQFRHLAGKSSFRGVVAVTPNQSHRVRIRTEGQKKDSSKYWNSHMWQMDIGGGAPEEAREMFVSCIARSRKFIHLRPRFWDDHKEDDDGLALCGTARAIDFGNFWEAMTGLVEAKPCGGCLAKIIEMHVDAPELFASSS